MSILLFYIITITNDNNKELLNDAEINHSSVFMLQVYFGKGKSPLHPPTYDGWDTSPLSL
jgi:hypothetical protein